MLNLDDAPKQERKADLPKEKKKPVPTGDAGPSAKPTKARKGEATVETTAATADTGSPAPAGPEEQGQKGQKKEKKTKEPATGAAEGVKKKSTGGGGGGGKAAAAEDAGEPAPSMIDLRVGHIVESRFSVFFVRWQIHNISIKLRSILTRTAYTSRYARVVYLCGRHRFTICAAN